MFALGEPSSKRKQENLFIGIMLNATKTVVSGPKQCAYRMLSVGRAPKQSSYPTLK